MGEAARKIGLIWDLITELAEDGETTGKIDYRNSPHGYGRMTVQLGDDRVTIYILPAGEDQP